MEITLQKSNQLKALAILMMLCLHLFNKPFEGLFEPILFFNQKPVSYYISLFCDACVPIFAFVSGYGLYFKYKQKQASYWKDNLKRLEKLYINYWIIIFLFVIVLGLYLNKEGYPGSISILIGNLTGLYVTYNGAWWFFTIYVLFVLTSSFWFTILDKVNPYTFLILLLIVYVGCFYLRVYRPANYQNLILNHIQNQTVLYGCTLFQFMLGAFALRFKWNSKISSIFIKYKYNVWLFAFGTMTLVVIHGIIPNFIIAPFTALAFIFLFTQLRVNLYINRTLDFFNPHATNMWLIHMFFYSIYFNKFIYSPKYVLPIYLLLVTCCILCSLLINRINRMVLSKIKLK